MQKEWKKYVTAIFIVVVITAFVSVWNPSAIIIDNANQVDVSAKALQTANNMMDGVGQLMALMVGCWFGGQILAAIMDFVVNLDLRPTSQEGETQ